MSSDGAGWAIDNISNGIIKHNPHIEFIRIDIHPRAVEQGLMAIQKLLKEGKVDLWHFQYWRSALQLHEIYPETKKIPSILTHHNHYCFEKDDWKNFKALTCQTKWGVNKMKELEFSNPVHIPHGIDLDRYEYIKDLKGTKVGYIGRVMRHKNLAKICETAKKLKYKVVGSGYIEKPDYWEEIDKSVLEFKGGVGRQNMNAAFNKDAIYEEMACFVMYSTEEKETGTLPLLEAMARGVPVLATEQGSARDLIQHGENGLIFTEGTFEHELKKIMTDEKLREKLRKNAWNTIKGYSEQRMARNHEKLYYRTVFRNDKIISIVIPTYNRADVLLKTLLSIEKNPYKAKEIIIANDGSTDHTKAVINECRRQFDTPIKYVEASLYDKDGEKTYGLAHARNKAAIESTGDILMFLDDRYEIEKDVLQLVADNCIPQTWSFGNKVIKGKLANKKSFVENFSWIFKGDFFTGGGFNEQINCYGGLSQETRERYASQGYGFNFVPKAVAKEIISTKSRNKRDEIWKAKYMISKMYD